MSSEHGGPSIPFDRMRWREKINEVKQSGVSVAQCIRTDFGHHTGSISHETWINVVEPLKSNFNHLEAVMVSLVKDIENSPDINLEARPGDSAPPPAEPPAGDVQDPPPVDPADLTKGYVPPQE